MKTKKILLLLLFLCSLVGFSQTFTIDFIDYEVISGTNNVKVTGYTGTATDVVIPTVVTNSGTNYNVTIIGDTALGNKGLTSVVLPSYLTNIERLAFTQNKLTNISFPSTLTFIGEYAFYDNNLTELVFPIGTINFENDIFGENNITEVKSYATNPDDLPAYIFRRLPAPNSNIDLIIPNGATTTYNSKDWTGFKSITEGIAIWTGATSSNPALVTNWHNNAPPSTTDEIYIPAGLTNYPTTSSTGASFTGDVTIESGATLINNGQNIEGDVTYKRLIPSTEWRLMSSPVEGQTVENIIANHQLAEGTPPNIGFGGYRNDNVPTWVYATNSETGVLGGGSGFAIKLAFPQEVNFTGILRYAEVSTTISTGDETNFNLIGNPYTAYVNSATFTSDNSSLLTEETIWIWDGTTYKTYNAISGGFEIAPTQGFFVEAKTTGLARFSLTNRSHNDFDTFSRTEPKSSFTLTLSQKDKKVSTNIFYIEGKTTGFDNGYDSSIFTGTTNEFGIFSELLTNDSDKKLAIQTLPNKNYEEMVIPLGVIAKAESMVTFSTNSTNLPTDLNVYLEDKVLGTITNLSKENHQVTLKNEMNGSGRFYIHTSAKALSVDDVINKKSQVKIYNSSKNTLTVKGIQADVAEVSIFNVLGKKVLSKSIGKGNSFVGVKDLSTGIYIVKLHSKLENISKKIIIE